MALLKVVGLKLSKCFKTSFQATSFLNWNGHQEQLKCSPIMNDQNRPFLHKDNAISSRIPSRRNFEQSVYILNRIRDDPDRPQLMPSDEMFKVSERVDLSETVEELQEIYKHIPLQTMKEMLIG